MSTPSCEDIILIPPEWCLTWYLGTLWPCQTHTGSRLSYEQRATTLLWTCFSLLAKCASASLAAPTGDPWRPRDAWTLSKWQQLLIPWCKETQSHSRLQDQPHFLPGRYLLSSFYAVGSRWQELFSTPSFVCVCVDTHICVICMSTYMWMCVVCAHISLCSVCTHS